MKKKIILLLIISIISSILISCSNEFTDHRDGKKYKTIKIGNQIWMAENLNYDAGSGCFCYDDTISNCKKYGKLYDLETANKVAPSGWHLPSKDEWEILLNNLGGEGNISYKKIIKDGESGFDALFGGWHYGTGGYDDIEMSGYFWSSTDSWLLHTYSTGHTAYMLHGNETYSYSVRLIKNADDVIKKNSEIIKKMDSVINDQNYEKFFIDPRDNKTYKTIKIGNQIWMSENLNYKTSNGSWCFNNESSYCSKYGRLYDWENAKKAIPPGWHLPTIDEFSQLVDFLGGEREAYYKMIVNGSSGFNALFGGYRHRDGSYYGIDSYAYFWTSTEFSDIYAKKCGVGANYNKSDFSYDNKDLCFSVRCIKNSDVKEIKN